MAANSLQMAQSGEVFLGDGAAKVQPDGHGIADVEVAVEDAPRFDGGAGHPAFGRIEDLELRQQVERGPQQDQRHEPDGAAEAVNEIENRFHRPGQVGCATMRTALHRQRLPNSRSKRGSRAWPIMAACVQEYQRVQFDTCCTAEKSRLFRRWKPGRLLSVGRLCFAWLFVCAGMQETKAGDAGQRNLLALDFGVDLAAAEGAADYGQLAQHVRFFVNLALLVEHDPVLGHDDQGADVVHVLIVTCQHDLAGST